MNKHNIEFTEEEIRYLTNFKATYSKFNPSKHIDYQIVVDIIAKRKFIPEHILFKKKLQYILDVMDGMVGHVSCTYMDGE